MIDWNYSLWTPWAQPCMPLYLTLTLNASFEPLRRGIGSTLFTSIIYFEDGVGTWAFRNDEAAALGNRMLDFLHVPEHQNGFEDELLASTANLEREIDAIVTGDGEGSRTIDELVVAFQRLENSYYRFYVLGAFVEPVQIAAQQRLTPALQAAAREAGISSDTEASDMASAAYASDEETFATGITRSMRDLARKLAEASQARPALNELLQEWPSTDDADGRKAAASRADAVVRLLRDSSPELANAVEEHARRYKWSLNNYARCLEMTASDVVREIMGHGKKTVQDAAQALSEELQVVNRNVAAAQDIKRVLTAHLSAFDAKTLSLHDLIGVRLLDLRKRLVMQTNGAVTKILRELAESLQMPLNSLLYLLPEEVPAFVRAPERYEDRIALRKQAVLVYRADLSVLDEQAYRWADGFSPMEGTYLGEGEVMAARILERLDQRLNLLEHEKSAGTEIFGTTIFYDRSNPVVRGRAVIIRDPATDLLEVGDILVASSTTPDFMGAIRRSSAIVTDWGGQTSHAAITARELGKPCIIGTNFASMVLRTGDEVELDFSLGIVRRVGS